MKSRPLGKDPSSKPRTIQGILMPDALPTGKRRPMEEILAEQGLLDDPTGDQPTVPAVVSGTAPGEPTKTPPTDIGAVSVIPLDGVSPSPFQPRKVFNPDLLEELADNIMANGLLNPIIVRPLEDGRYELVGGERRFRAHRLLGKETIKASIIAMDDEAAMVAALADNTGSEPLTAYENACAIKRMMAQIPNASISMLSRKTGINKGTISKNMSFFSLPPRVIEMLEVNPGLLGQASAIEMARVCPEHNDLVIDAVELIQSGMKSQIAAIARLNAQVRKRSHTPTRAGRRVFNMIDQGKAVTQAVITGKKITLKCAHISQSDEVLTRIINALGITVLDEEIEPTPAQREEEACADE